MACHSALVREERDCYTLCKNMTFSAVLFCNVKSANCVFVHFIQISSSVLMLWFMIQQDFHDLGVQYESALYVSCVNLLFLSDHMLMLSVCHLLQSSFHTVSVHGTSINSYPISVTF